MKRTLTKRYQIRLAESDYAKLQKVVESRDFGMSASETLRYLLNLALDCLPEKEEKDEEE